MKLCNYFVKLLVTIAWWQSTIRLINVQISRKIIYHEKASSVHPQLLYFINAHIKHFMEDVSAFELRVTGVTPNNQTGVRTIFPQERPSFQVYEPLEYSLQALDRDSSLLLQLLRGYAGGGVVRLDWLRHLAGRYAFPFGWTSCETCQSESWFSPV